MSLLYVFCNDSQGVMVGDHRRYKVRGENFNPDEVTEFFDDSKKVFRVSDELIIGVAGYEIKMLNDLIQHIVIKKYTYESAVNSIKGLIEQNRDNLKKYKTIVLMLGVVEGKTFLYSLRTDIVFEDKYLSPEGYIGTCAAYDPQRWIDEQFEDNDYSIDRLKRIGVDLVKHVSERDKFVSPGFDMEVVSIDGRS